MVNEVPDRSNVIVQIFEESEDSEELVDGFSPTYSYK